MFFGCVLSLLQGPLGPHHPVTRGSLGRCSDAGAGPASLPGGSFNPKLSWAAIQQLPSLVSTWGWGRSSLSWFHLVLSLSSCFSGAVEHICTLLSLSRKGPMGQKGAVHECFHSPVPPGPQHCSCTLPLPWELFHFLCLCDGRPRPRRTGGWGLLGLGRLSWTLPPHSLLGCTGQGGGGCAVSGPWVLLSLRPAPRPHSCPQLSQPLSKPRASPPPRRRGGGSGCWGCRNRTPRPGGLQQQTFILSHSGVWKARVKVSSAGVGSSEAPPSGLPTSAFLRVLTWSRLRAEPLVSLL